jgi:hypothetical protein
MKIKFLCAYNPKTNKFFAFENDGRSTTPLQVDHPYYSEKIVPYSFQNEDEFFKEVRPAPYYFENSSRMREWLSGFTMVLIEMTMEYKVLK